MSARRIITGTIAIICLIALIWWVAWSAHALRGWTAMPLGFTVGIVLYAGLIIFAVLAIEDRR